jgi:hypothetical protein
MKQHIPEKGREVFHIRALDMDGGYYGGDTHAVLFVYEQGGFVRLSEADAATLTAAFGAEARWINQAITVESDSDGRVKFRSVGEGA